MIVVREPVLHPVAILDLRPTQITVGMREVEDKCERLRAAHDQEDRQIPRRSHDPGDPRAEGPSSM